jgi:hypothetical protein
MTEQKDKTDGDHTRAAIQIGFDVLNILTDQFRRDMGRQFDAIWAGIQSELLGASKELFHGINPHRENIHVNLYLLKSRYENMAGETDEAMVLDAFADVIGRVVGASKRTLGEVLVDNALQEAMKMLSMVDKYKQDMMPADYFKKKIQGGF